MKKVMTVSEKIRELRVAKGLSQDKLAVLSDVAVQTIRRIEQEGNGYPSFKTLSKLAKALDVTVNDLID